MNKTSVILYIAGIVLVAGALITGISDNLPGILLLYTGLTVILLGVVHRWRSIKKFLILFGASFIGFFVFVVLHNGMYAFGMMAADIALLNKILGVFGGAFFLAAVMLCPVGIVVGGFGSLITLIFKKRGQERL